MLIATTVHIFLSPLKHYTCVYIFVVRPVSGASMNPGRSLGPAMVYNCYKGIWIYIASPILGAVAGAWVYNTVRYTDKPLREITKSGSFLKALQNSSSR